MRKQSSINLFEDAISKKKLFEFAIGSGKYFLPDREYGDHWTLGTWQQYIVPSLRNGADVLMGVNRMFEILRQSPYERTVKEALLYHLHVYCYLKSQDKISAILDSQSLSLSIRNLEEYAATIQNIYLEEFQIIITSIDRIKNNCR